MKTLFSWCVFAKNIVRDKTYFNVVLITTNRPKSFEKPEVIETGFYDFHKKSVATMVVLFNKQKAKNQSIKKI